MARPIVKWKCNACGGTYSDTQASGIVYMHACPPSVSDGVAGQVPVVNPRDETVTLDARGHASGIKSEGAGVTPLSGQSIAEPQWILTARTAPAAP